MKRALVCLFVVLAVAVVLAAQQAPLYTVQEGDNLWNLAGQKLDDPTVWGQIMDMYPFLKDEKRIIRKDADHVVVILRPGEQLRGLEKLGIIPAPAPAPVAAPAPIPTNPVATSGFPWLYLFLALLVLAAMVYGWLRRNPVTAGPAMVPGGVRDDTAREHLLAQANRRFPSQSFTIVRTTRGRLNGLMTVRYSDGTERQRILRNDVGYQALVRFPDGREETLYMLQGCGNDLRYSGIARYIPGAGFSFTPDHEVPATAPVVPAPQPTPAPAPAPQVRIEPVPQAVGAAASPVRRSLFFTPAEGERPNMIKTSGFREVRFEQTGDEMTLRFS